MSKARTIIRSMSESSDPFKIEELKNSGVSVKEAEELIRKNWHENLSYKGHKFFDKIYIEVIIPAAEKALKIDNNNGQESYLGYLKDEDTFISGFDTWADDDGDYDDDDDDGGSNYDGSDNDPYGSVAYIKVDSNGNARVIKISGDPGDMMYSGPRNTHRDLKYRHKDLVDIRLD